MSGADGNVPVASDGSGRQKVRTITLDVLQPDGTVQTVQQQVVTLYDESGEPIDGDGEWKNAVLARLSTICELLALLLDEEDGGFESRDEKDDNDQEVIEQDD